MFVPLRHAFAVFGIGTLLACDVVDRLREEVAESPAEPESAEPVAAEPVAQEPPPAQTPSEQAAVPDALGSQVARIIDRERTPVAGPRGADLERVEQVTVTRMEGGWSQTTGGGTMRPEGVVFALDMDVEVGDEVGINQARLVAKATCKVGDEVRASSGDVFGSGSSSAWGGASPISADPGKYEHAVASLFLQQDVVGHEPCQVELRMASPLSDKPLRVDGVWCLRDGKLGEGACEELGPPAEPPTVQVRDWKIDRTRRNIEVTLDVGERIWLDRTLMIRSSCDDGGERVPRTQMVWGPQWGLLDPGDSVRALASHWNGWFATTGPCELTAELWRRNDRGQWSGREEIGYACVEAFLPQEGRCPSSAPPPAGAGIVTLRKFEPDITRDPYDRRTRLIQATVELVAHENLDGRYQLEFRGECGKGRGAVPLWLGGAMDVEPAMLQAGEVMKAEYRSYLGRGSAGRCEVEAKLVPTDPAGTPISLGKTCFDDKGTKPC